MCLLSKVLLIIPVLMICYAVYWYLKENQKAFLGAGSISGFLNQPQVKRRIFSIIVDGYYKGREVRYRYIIDNEGSTAIWFVIPGRLPQSQPFFLFKYPPITTNTFLRRNKIYFKGAEKFDSQNILNELSKAAEIVETNLVKA